MLIKPFLNLTHLNMSTFFFETLQLKSLEKSFPFYFSFLEKKFLEKHKTFYLSKRQRKTERIPKYE